MARGISTPRISIGPDRSHRILVKDTTVTTELTSPIDMVCVVFATSVMSASIRWSGLSMDLSMNLPR